MAFSGKSLINQNMFREKEQIFKEVSVSYTVGSLPK